MGGEAGDGGGGAEGGDGMTVEDRVIRSSLTMITKGGKKNNSEMTLSIFNLFAAFPEDVAVPFDVFVALLAGLQGIVPQPGHDRR